MSSKRAFQIVAEMAWPQLQGEPTQLADQLVATAQRSLSVTGVGLAWMDSGRPGALIAASDKASRRIEELQFILGEGPCTASAVAGRPVLVEDLAGQHRSWPQYAAGAARAGVAAVFAFPLLLGGVTFGVLTLYCDTPGPLSVVDAAEAAAVATVGTWVLMHLQPGLQDQTRFPDLTERLADRLKVHRAAGMLAAQLALPIADALNILRTRAFADDRPIADLAQAVLHDTDGFCR